MEKQLLEVNTIAKDELDHLEEDSQQEEDYVYYRTECMSFSILLLPHSIAVLGLVLYGIAASARVWANAHARGSIPIIGLELITGNTSYIIPHA
jgi:hypothetical protein